MEGMIRRSFFPSSIFATQIPESCGKLKYAASEFRTMAAQPSTIEFYERRPLQEFAVGVRKFVPLRVTNLQVDYDDGL